MFSKFLTLVSHEPVLFAAVITAANTAVAAFLPVGPEAKGALVAFGLAVAAFVRASVTPNAKL